MKRTVYITDGEYAVYPISNEDRANYVELHRQINGDKSLFLNPVTKDIMWDQMLTGETETFSIFDKDNIYCGSIDLQKPLSNTPEIGIDLMENMRNKGIAPKVITMFVNVTFERLHPKYFIIRISSKNPHSIHVFEKLGAVHIEDEESAFKKFMRNFRERMTGANVDDIEKSIKIYFDAENESEEEIVHKYKLLPELLK